MIAGEACKILLGGHDASYHPTNLWSLSGSIWVLASYIQSHLRHHEDRHDDKT